MTVVNRPPGCPLIYQQQIQTERLTVPHYGLQQREFVVYPLLEIAPDLQIPGLGALTTIADTVPLNGLTRLAVATRAH